VFAQTRLSRASQLERGTTPSKALTWK